MRTGFRFVAVLVSISLYFSFSFAGDWPAFRGPQGVGVSSDNDLPIQWTKDNVLWKVKIPGVGSSSPITIGDKIFVTCYSGYGTTMSKGFGKGGFGKGGFGKGTDQGDQKKLRLHVLCYDNQKGNVLWQKEIEPKLPEMAFAGFIREHGYTSSTPVTDGESLFVFFGKTGVLAFDMEGKELWQTNVGTGTHKWGSAASPVVYKDLVIVNAAMESKSVVALNKKTGKEIWRIKGIGPCWTSPLLVKNKEGKTELVLSLQGKVVGYDPATGAELWHCQGIGKTTGFGYTCSTPAAKGDVVYILGGGGPNGKPTALAVRVGGQGDVTNTHVLWRQSTGTAIASPVVSGDFVYWVAGTAVCLRADTGKVVYNERLYNGFGEYVSPIIAGDKIFALTRFDGMFVLEGGEKFQKLAANQFEEGNSIFNGSPAISKSRIFVRSNDYLYCIGKK